MAPIAIMTPLEYYWTVNMGIRNTLVAFIGWKTRGIKLKNY
jgi:hypothetical protein